MKRVWAALLFSIALQAFADDRIDRINQEVARLDQLIAAKQLELLTVASSQESEGRPPEIGFYSLQGRLVAATISVGHETWSSVTTVYFRADGAPLKYLKVLTGRTDVPARQAVFYDAQARVFWSSGAAPAVTPADLLRSYRLLSSLRKSAASY
jgi:hypothetical protein